MSETRFSWPVRPLASPSAIVGGNTFRLTVLTPSLLRLEYSADGMFEDRASQSVFYRDFEDVPFTLTRSEGVLKVETAALSLCYHENAPFTKDTLSVTLKTEPGTTWCFGDDIEDLGGTLRTLDLIDGDVPLGHGVCSRRGIAVLDDSHTMLLGEDGWVEVRSEDTVDLYLFAYGYDYRGAVRDLMRLTGAPPLLPAYALGNWWSRYHAYSDTEYLELMDRFAARNIPFSVGVVDMDWHITEIPADCLDPDDEIVGGWTGYTWNKALFPDHKAFLAALKDRHLKTALNLHPHSGVNRHEAMYDEMARACGMDPASGKRVPFDILSKTFMANYFDILHHPHEADGVDFWWMDWQQGTDYWWIHERNTNGNLQDEREVLDPLWMLNHLHIMDISRNGKRPMFFSRYSGPGSQRYPVGFSGDTVVSWESLRFQPYFTATASNIGYPWWSHDIGGHMRGYRDDELTLRWMQLGVFSPINRLHSANSLFNRKEPWCYGAQTQPIMEEWLRLRHALFPYLYAMNYRAHDELTPLIEPLYYAYPLENGAYEAHHQYLFGSELMVAALAAPRSQTSGLAATSVWMPKGDWFDFFSGMHYRCTRPHGRKFTAYRDLNTYPVFAKAGAIVPMAVYDDNRLDNAAVMDVVVFPGADGAFTLHEDAGDGYGTKATTAMALTWGDKATFTIAPATGDLTLIPKMREWRVRLRGFHKDITATAAVDGNAYDAAVSYDAATNTTTVTVTAAVTSHVEVAITGSTLIHDNADLPARMEAVLQQAQMPILMKMSWYDICLDPTQNVRDKFNDMGAFTQGYADVRDALRELLTLTED